MLLLALILSNNSLQGDHRTPKSSRHRKTWYEGKHQGFISDELFEVCEQIREGMVSHRMLTNRRRTYILYDRTFCARCLVSMPHGLQDDNYGKMRPYWDHRREYGYYRRQGRRETMIVAGLTEHVWLVEERLSCVPVPDNT